MALRLFRRAGLPFFQMYRHWVIVKVIFIGIGPLVTHTYILRLLVFTVLLIYLYGPILNLRMRYLFNIIRSLFELCWITEFLLTMLFKTGGSITTSKSLISRRVCSKCFGTNVFGYCVRTESCVHWLILLRMTLWRNLMRLVLYALRWEIIIR